VKMTRLQAQPHVSSLYLSTMVRKVAHCGLQCIPSRIKYNRNGFIRHHRENVCLEPVSRCNWCYDDNASEAATLLSPGLHFCWRSRPVATVCHSGCSSQLLTPEHVSPSSVPRVGWLEQEQQRMS